MRNKDKIGEVFEKQRPVFIAYLTAGHGGMNHSLDAALALIKGGVDILEIGIPFSDPIADGPVIQKAMEQSLKQGTNLFDALALVKRIREKSDIPIVLFSYLNPILQANKKGFLKKAKQIGIDGVLIVDLPLEENNNLVAKCKNAGIKMISIIAPSTPIARIHQIVDCAEGFIYYICRNGITGVKKILPKELPLKIKQIKRASKLPVVVGFGISTKTMAKEITKYADGFVVGSFFVNAIENRISPGELSLLAKQINPKY